MPGIGLGLGIAFGKPSTGLEKYIDQMAFWSGEFDFTAKTLTDKSGNENDVPLIAGNCVNFINDVTITLSVPQIGATVSEVNFSETTTGVTVNGSGHIEIDQSELAAKLYQIKLSTGDEFFLTGGTNVYALCSSVLYGKLGGTEDADWEWSTQDDYFGNLQRGYSINKPLFNLFPASMLDVPEVTGEFAAIDANTIRYTGIAVPTTTVFRDRNSAPFTLGRIYQIKITVSNSTEDFSSTDLRIQYFNNVLQYTDDEGVALTKNGVHIVTVEHDYLNRIDFVLAQSGDHTGRTFDIKVDYVSEIDATLFIPAFDTITDAAGNPLTNPSNTKAHNGCEVQLDFSGITGVTGAGGGAFSPPADYDYGDALTNPMFKRLKFNSNLQGEESDYIIFEEFINGDVLSGVLLALEEPNMLINSNDEGFTITSQKYDADNDVVAVFGPKGYNELYTYVDQVIMPNTLELPVTHTLKEIEAVMALNYFSDVIGPFNISGLGWAGGAHLSPGADSIQPGWEEITDVDDAADTVTIADTTEFPDPPPGKKRVLEVKVYSGGDYDAVERSSYTKSGGVLSLFPLFRGGGVVLSSVVPGAVDPPYTEYNFNTGRESSKSISGGASAWQAVKSAVIKVVNEILDYTEVDKDDLSGGEIITETVRYLINQKSPTVYIDYSSEFLVEHIINTYYGLQENTYPVAANARMYFAHGVSKELQTIALGRDSGDRATYISEKSVYIDDVTDNEASKNKAIFMDLGYGTPAENVSTSPYWWMPSKAYFNMILNQTKEVGDLVTWRGGYNKFKNLASSQYVLAYYQVENGSLYFIVDFTDSLTFGSINELFTELAGRNCEVIYQDPGVAIADTPGDSFTIPNAGLDLTATSAGNIKIKLS